MSNYFDFLFNFILISMFEMHVIIVYVLKRLTDVVVINWTVSLLTLRLMLFWFAEKIQNMLWNVYQYYRQFLPSIDKFISDTRKTISDAVKVPSTL